MAFVNFVVPTLWRPTLTRAVESLLAQTDSDWEAIICPDALVQNKALALDMRMELPKDRRVGYAYVPIEESGSAGSVRNVGLERARDCEWVGFLDDDDRLTPTYVEHLREHADDYPQADLVIFRMQHPLAGVLPPLWNEVRKGTVGISFAVKQEVMKDFRFIRENVSAYDHEDWAMVHEIMRRGHTFFLSPHIDYLVRDAT